MPLPILPVDDPLPHRQRGKVPYKANTLARSAIADFVDGNIGRLQCWLDRIADGVKDEDGEFVIAPNPEKAFQLFQSVIEYHVPKLARTEVTGGDGEPIQHSVSLTVVGVPGGFDVT